MNQQDPIKVIDRHLRKATDAVAGMRAATSGEGLLTAWESYLREIIAAFDKMAGFGKTQVQAKPWAHRLRQSLDGSDPGLVYLKEARNAEGHGFSQLAESKEPAAEFAGIRLEEGWAPEFKGCTYNGKPMGDFRIAVAGGRVSELRGQPFIPIKMSPAEMKLLDVYSDVKKRSFLVPAALARRTLTPGEPFELATAGLEHGRKCLDELKDLVQ